MKLNVKNMTCGIFLVIGLYLIYTLLNPGAVKPIAIRNSNANNANANNANANNTDENYVNNDENYITYNNENNINYNNANAINATAYANINVNRNQTNPLDIDRPPFIEENPTIINANEIYMDNFKDYTINQTGKNELYTNDEVLFQENNNGNVVPLDLNDGTHRRVNFY